MGYCHSSGLNFTLWKCRYWSFQLPFSLSNVLSVFVGSSHGPVMHISHHINLCGSHSDILLWLVEAQVPSLPRSTPSWGMWRHLFFCLIWHKPPWQSTCYYSRHFRSRQLFLLGPSSSLGCLGFQRCSKHIAAGVSSGPATADHERFPGPWDTTFSHLPLSNTFPNISVHALNSLCFIFFFMVMNYHPQGSDCNAQQPLLFTLHWPMGASSST